MVPVRIALLMSQRPGSAVLGALANFRDKLSVDWLLGDDAVELHEQARRHGFVNSKYDKAREWDNVCKDDSVNALIVSSPQASVNMLRRALSRGKSVLCEYPVSLQPAALIACHEEADLNGAHLLFSFPRQFDPALAKVKALLDEGLLGDIYRIATGVNHTQDEHVAYLRHDMAAIFKKVLSVQIDSLCWLLGTWPHTVSTSGLHQWPICSGKVALNFNTAVATIGVNDRIQSQDGVNIKIEGSKGMLLLTKSQPGDSSILKVQLGDGPWRSVSVPVVAAPSSPVSGMLKHLLSAINGENNFSEDKAHSLNAIRVTAACRTSHNTKQGVNICTPDSQLPNVKLPLVMWKERPAAWF